MSKQTNRDWGEALRERVHDMETPPSSSLWSNIEHSLEVQPTLATPRHHNIWQWVGSAAAVAAVIIAMLQIDPTQEDQIIKIDDSSTPEIAHKFEDVTIVTPTIEEVDDITPEVVTPSIESTPQTKTIELNREDKMATETPKAQEQKSNKSDKNGSSTQRNTSRKYNNLYAENSSFKRTDRETAISLSGSGSLFSQGSNGAYAVPANSAAYDALTNPTGYKSGSSSNVYDYCDATHHQPFSIGVRVQHSLTPRLRLVSGLNYTQLISDIKYNSNISLLDEQQQIHFLGVPLRFDYDIYSSKHLSLYAGAGGAVEYCVGATLGDKKMDEKRWHYSTGVALGAEYKVNSWLGFYFEPELNYYLTTTQLKSSRNDSPTTCTLRLGVSFTL